MSPGVPRKSSFGAHTKCAGEDLNLHGLFTHKALNLARLPIPPPARGSRHCSQPAETGDDAVSAAQAGFARRSLAPVRQREDLSARSQRLAKRADFATLNSATSAWAAKV